MMSIIILFKKLLLNLRLQYMARSIFFFTFAFQIERFVQKRDDDLSNYVFILFSHNNFLFPEFVMSLLASFQQGLLNLR